MREKYYRDTVDFLGVKTMTIIKSWNKKTIRIREDRYVNLTDMAQSSGKFFADYSRLVSTKSYFKTLSSVMGIPITSLVQVIQGGKAQDQGTWGHPKVALRFAQWCSDEFAVQVDCWIDELLTTGKVELAAPEPKRAIAYYTDRIVDLKHRLSCPSGYWTAIEECGSLLLDVERAGYPIDKFDLLDGSVGKRWSNHRKSLGWEDLNVWAQYKVDQCPKPVAIRAYPYSEMGEFKQFLKEIYEPQHLPVYLHGKYGALVKV